MREVVDIKKWCDSAAQERAEIYAYVGLKPVKKSISYPLFIVTYGDFFNFNCFDPNYFTSAAEEARLRYWSYQLNRTPVILLFQNLNGELQCFLDQGLFLPMTQISFNFNDDTVRTEINQHITNGNRTLSDNHYAAVTAVLAGEGYQLELNRNSIFEPIEFTFETYRFLGQPILKRDEVNFLNAYLSWYDFFNDIKACVVKPLTVLFLTLKNVFTMIYHFYAGANLVLRGQANDGFEQFDLAEQSLTKALVYALMTWNLLVLIAQLLSIASRIMMSMPGILTSIPETMRACTEEGCLTVARQGFSSFATGFCGMFSAVPPDINFIPANNVPVYQAS